LWSQRDEVLQQRPERLTAVDLRIGHVVDELDGHRV
jgi:hypothetical protein